MNLKPSALGLLFLSGALILFAETPWLPQDTKLLEKSGSPCIASSGNTVYVVSEGAGGIVVNISSDRGRHWLNEVIRVNAKDYMIIRHPQVSCWDDHVYVLWEGLQDSFHGIYFNTSWDRGMTWLTDDIRLDSRPQIVYDYLDPPSDLNPKIACSGLRVYVVWSDDRNNLSSSYYINHDIYFNASRDGGLTWQTSDVRLNSGSPPGKHDSFYPEISCSGDLVSVVWTDDRHNPKREDVYVNSSLDGGTTWQKHDTRLSTESGRGVHPKITCYGKGIYVIWRSSPPGSWDSDIHFNSSNDGGKNWQIQESQLNTWNLGTKQPIICCTAGKIYVVWLEDIGPEWDVYNIFFRSSSDGGLTWQTYGTHINAKENLNLAEFRMVAASDTIYVVWSSEGDIYLNLSTDGGQSWLRPTDIRLDNGDAPGESLSRDLTVTGSSKAVYCAWVDDRGEDWRVSKIYFNVRTAISHMLNLTAGPGGTTRPEPGSYRVNSDAQIGIEAFPDELYRFSGWTGDVIGFDNPVDFRMTGDMNVKANFTLLIYPPLDFSGRKVLNRSLFLLEYINELTWRPNSRNTVSVRYRIYLNADGEWQLLAEVGAADLKYWHRNVDKKKFYIYAIKSVDSEGYESEPAIITVT